MEFASDDHIRVIDAAVQSLNAIQARTAHPAPTPHQLVGTVNNNTMAMLIGAANFLDQGARMGHFTETKNWISFMQAVHRSFFSTLHLAIERGLHLKAENEGIVITSSTDRAFKEAYESLERMLDNEAARVQLRKLRKIAPGLRPGFDDYLNAVITACRIEKEQAKMWRRYFRCLSIIRNKASHSDPTLNDAESTDLRNGGFSAMVEGDGNLVMNASMYKPVVEAALGFLDLITGISDGTSNIQACMAAKSEPANAPVVEQARK